MAKCKIGDFILGQISGGFLFPLLVLVVIAVVVFSAIYLAFAIFADFGELHRQKIAQVNALNK